MSALPLTPRAPQVPLAPHAPRAIPPKPIPREWDSIPEELRARPGWVVWRFELDKGRHKKVPHSPRSGRKVDPTTAAYAYQEACGAFARGGYDGIGHTVTAEDPYCGVDLDKCRDPDTGTIAPWAQAIVERLQTYTEISPSGRGLRLWLRGKVPGPGRHKDDIEVYDHGHFFTTTGHHLHGTPTTVADRDQELAAWYHETFPPAALVITTTERAPQEHELDDAAVSAWVRQQPGGQALWNGDWGGAYRSQSEADLALCRLLVRMTRSRAQIDRLFRQSGLFREKWESRRGSDTYGGVTITKALASSTASAAVIRSSRPAEQVIGQIVDHALRVAAREGKAAGAALARQLRDNNVAPRRLHEVMQLVTEQLNRRVRGGYTTNDAHADAEQACAEPPRQGSYLVITPADSPEESHWSNSTQCVIPVWDYSNVTHVCRTCCGVADPAWPQEWRDALAQACAADALPADGKPKSPKSLWCQRRREQKAVVAHTLTLLWPTILTERRVVAKQRPTKQPPGYATIQKLFAATNACGHDGYECRLLVGSLLRIAAMRRAAGKQSDPKLKYVVTCLFNAGLQTKEMKYLARSWRPGVVDTGHAAVQVATTVAPLSEHPAPPAEASMPITPVAAGPLPTTMTTATQETPIPFVFDDWHDDDTPVAPSARARFLKSLWASIPPEQIKPGVPMSFYRSDTYRVCRLMANAFDALVKDAEAELHAYGCLHPAKRGEDYLARWELRREKVHQYEALRQQEFAAALPGELASAVALDVACQQARAICRAGGTPYELFQLAMTVNEIDPTLQVTMTDVASWIDWTFRYAAVEQHAG